jgi:hypothetical protein
MSTLAQLLLGVVLIAVTVAIHVGVMGWLLLQLEHRARSRFTLWHAYAVLTKVAIWSVLAHLVEIAVWALAFYWAEVQRSIDLSIYFSAVTYATIGYGDVVPPENWRVLASMEGLIGILMCAWSGGFMFALVSRLHQEAAARRRA